MCIIQADAFDIGPPTLSILDRSVCYLFVTLFTFVFQYLKIDLLYSELHSNLCSFLCLLSGNIIFKALTSHWKHQTVFSVLDLKFSPLIRDKSHF